MAAPLLGVFALGPVWSEQAVSLKPSLSSIVSWVYMCNTNIVKLGEVTNILRRLLEGCVLIRNRGWVWRQCVSCAVSRTLMFEEPTETTLAWRFGADALTHL